MSKSHAITMSMRGAWAGVFMAFQHFLRRFHILETWYKSHVSLTPDLLHAFYQANGVVILVISEPFESSYLPSLEAVHNMLKD